MCILPMIISHSIMRPEWSCILISISHLAMPVRTAQLLNSSIIYFIIIFFNKKSFTAAICGLLTSIISLFSLFSRFHTYQAVVSVSSQEMTFFNKLLLFALICCIHFLIILRYLSSFTGIPNTNCMAALWRFMINHGKIFFGGEWKTKHLIYVPVYIRVIS